MLLHEGSLAAAAFLVGAGLVFLFQEWRWRRILRERETVWAVTTPAGTHSRAMTMAEAQKLVGSARDSVLGSIGTVRRDVEEVSNLIGALQVKLQDAIGRSERDREKARQEGLLTEESRNRLHAAIQGLHRDVGTLAKAATAIEQSVGDFKKWMS